MLASLLTLALSAGIVPADGSAWEFPNFSDRIQLTVQNAQSTPFNGIATVPLQALSRVDAKFGSSLLLAAEEGKPARALATQSGEDAVSVEIHLAPHEQKTVSLYYSRTLHDKLPEVPRVFASHNYGYNHATAALESEWIGYRTYGGFFLDVQAHAPGQHGLFNSMLGYSSITNPPAQGRDVIHLGDTLGLGGLFLQSGGETFRPPVSTPDYVHRPPKPGEPQYKVLAAGPLRAVIEESLPDWSLGNDHVALRAEYEMDADEEVVHCRWWLTPLKLTRTYVVGAGIRNLPAESVREAADAFATEGVQDPAVGRIALGLSFDESARRAPALHTAESANQIVLFRELLASGHAVQGAYTVAAAWKGSGWPDPAAHVLDVLQSQSAPVKVLVGSHEINPYLQALEGEPK